MGTIRTAMRVFYAEHGRYPNVSDVPVTQSPGLGDSLNISAMDLNGKYFSASNYSVTVVEDTSYTITCTNADVLGTGKTRTLDHRGELSDN
ncbi:MAG: hypothetical protein M0R44_01720 [Candidatus Marinimicrobia bacterium]|nr:hypothetical protein [Candidatus Neomarinimicrobiota bacterium]